MFHFIYKITNTINGKFYIGRHSTDNIDDGYMGSGTAIQRAIKKYGKKNFIKEILEYTNSFDDLVLLENQYITKDLILSEDCYNMSPGGLGGTITENWDDERRQRHSDVMSRVNNDEDKKLKTANTVSKLHKDLGKGYWSPEGYQNVVNSLLENNGGSCGWTDERRYQYSERMKITGQTAGKWERTEESRKNLSEARKGKGCGDRNAMKRAENKEKLSRAKRGRKKMISNDNMTTKYVKPEEFEKYIDQGYRFADKDFAPPAFFVA